MRCAWHDWLICILTLRVVTVGLLVVVAFRANGVVDSCAELDCGARNGRDDVGRRWPAVWSLFSLCCGDCLGIGAGPNADARPRSL